MLLKNSKPSKPIDTLTSNLSQYQNLNLEIYYQDY